MAQLSFSNIKPLHNVFINPCMDIWQRGTSQTLSASEVSYYQADRWLYAHNMSTGVVTYARNTGGPSWPATPDDLPYMINIAIDTADTSIAAGEYGFLQQSVEGFVGRHLLGKKVTISFYAYGSTTGTYCVALRSGDNTRTYIAEYTIDAVNTMERKVITFTMDDPNDTKYPVENTACFKVAFTTVCGSTYHGSAGWNTGNYLATSNQTNLYASSSNYLLVTGFQMTEGEDPGYLIPRSFGEELALCQRYYEKSYNHDVAPGTVTLSGAIAEPATRNATTLSRGCRWRVEKNHTPTVVIWAPWSGNSGYCTEASSTDRVASGNTIGKAGMPYILITAAGTLTIEWHYTAEAEL